MPNVFRRTGYSRYIEVYFYLLYYSSIHAVFFNSRIKSRYEMEISEGIVFTLYFECLILYIYTYVRVDVCVFAYISAGKIKKDITLVSLITLIKYVQSKIILLL